MRFSSSKSDESEKVSGLRREEVSIERDVIFEGEGRRSFVRISSKPFISDMSCERSFTEVARLETFFVNDTLFVLVAV